MGQSETPSDAAQVRTIDDEVIDVQAVGGLVEINVLDGDEMLSTVALDPDNAKRLAFLIDAACPGFAKGGPVSKAAAGRMGAEIDANA